MITDAGMVAILDLHWTAPAGFPATGQQAMPDESNAYDFWKSVAQSFNSHDRVIFELFNEPFPDNGNWNSQAGWQCLRDGGYCPGFSFWAAGMQVIVSIVRETGAKNIILVGGLAWSNSLAQWLEYMPYDPEKNIGASWHSYNFNYCNNENCWDSSVGVVKAQYPVVCTEFGENDCAGEYVTGLMLWMDTKQISYLAWTYNPFDCKSGPALISSYNNGGDPTGYGWAVKNHYASK